MTPSQLKYFDSMVPHQTIHIAQVKDPSGLVQAGKEYIDQGGPAMFNDDYTVFTKLHPIPKDGKSYVIIQHIPLADTRK